MLQGTVQIGPSAIDSGFERRNISSAAVARAVVGRRGIAVVGRDRSVDGVKIAVNAVGSVGVARSPRE
ncbi:hypothetical protein [Halobaculum roseum]|uniref:Uncharacterized protein n=1 Tax=Halobaculum roseum TaxID=2175149 RepID=A0ABD5MPY5_9EURY|nr:hypothetical protein [Halobaculum roseum]QZY03988.1 hypothetical protein K6T36_07465 [Halobaculum roseum]